MTKTQKQFSSSFSPFLKIKVFDITTIPANQEATILKNGDGFRILELKFDKAGHYSESVSLEPTYFQLPPQIIRVNFSKDLYVNDDQKFHFQEDDWVNLQVSDDGKVLNFAHKTIFNSNFNISGFEKPEARISSAVDSYINKSWEKKTSSIPVSDVNSTQGDLDIPSFLRKKGNK